MLFDVLGFSTGEIAVMMDTTVAAVTAALQRARATLTRHGPPGPSQQVALARPGEHGQRELVARCTAALRTHDVQGMLALLSADATWTCWPCGGIGS